MRRFIACEIERCVGCGACVVACVAQNHIAVSEGQMTLRRMGSCEQIEKQGIRIYFYTEACRHCQDMLCAEVCPKGCFRRDERSGFVICNPEQCVGCGLCVKTCVFQAVSIFHKKASKCNGCVQNVLQGKEPACVRSCITGALRLYSETEYKESIEEGKYIVQGKEGIVSTKCEIWHEGV